MLVLGIESSCDECSAAVVEDGKKILSNVIATQIEIHKKYDGVVPEIASRTHTEWVKGVVESAIKESGCTLDDIDGISVTNRPGLIGSLMVGLSYAKGLSASSGIPFVGIDHILAHLYASQLENDIEYPFLGLIVSGGHTVIGKVQDFDNVEVLGTTIDDACGEAYDKVAKHYGLGYPGGVLIDELAQKGDPAAFNFPDASLHKGAHRYDVSYSGLKTAVINQLNQFHNEGYEINNENIAASFQKAAIGMLAKRLFKAASDTGINKVVVGGGVAANSYLRSLLKDKNNLEVYFPSMLLCTDNAAMVAGLGYHYLNREEYSDLTLNAGSRVMQFKNKYP
ncbi:MAG: tRNA (adenosine(37)-N6)-threonylcarbamoyltransferase complex transferase subunit TsaD [Spirochaetales bacterium]|nr:tRNA (adenosine(37)-N6)-threonylcarbamoyltransferase complex transferase subunit TsaD [Spirochaetales bacterium]